MTDTLRLAQGTVDFLGVYTLEIHVAILMALVTAAAIIDIREHRIPNWLVAGGLLTALGYHAFLPFGHGWLFALAGLVVGMAALMPLYVLKTMGAGDVKLMGMVGAFLGTTAAIGAILATLIAGGVLSLAVSAHKRMLRQLASNLLSMIAHRDIRQFGAAAGVAVGHPRSVGKLPYAIAIAAGTAIQVFWLRT